MSLPGLVTAAGATAATPTRPAVAFVEPLSPERYRVQFTASAKLRDKIARARDLLAHQIPGGELSTIVERAFDLLLEKLEKQRLGKTKRPRSTTGTAAQPERRAQRALGRGTSTKHRGPGSRRKHQHKHRGPGSRRKHQHEHEA